MRPLLIDSIARGCDSYITETPKPVPGVNRSWSYNGRVRSMEWRAGGMVKSRSPFRGHLEPDDFHGLLEVAASHGVTMPSSYSELFRAHYFAPALTGPCRRALNWPCVGGWESLLVPPGRYPGTWYKYDMRSAYLWALGFGLPDPATYRYTEERDAKQEGCYLMACESSDTAPYPYNRGGNWPVLGSEIDAYRLAGRVLYGVTWSGNLSPEPLLAAIYRWPCWREVGRAYWGGWASTASVVCRTYDDFGYVRREWKLPPYSVNPIWAHIILSRVRARLYEVSRNAARVYVDNIITRDILPVGDAVGDWRLEHIYHGLSVEHVHHIASFN